MTSNEITLPSGTTVRAQAQELSQATAVEQARAVAEVQAAIVVAQQVPRDTDKALAQMRQSCAQRVFADRAFYAVPNRGSGPSVHLARELARTFGNIQYGVHELRRDDDAGVSEIQAFAWDVENNVRSTRTFISPHVRMAGGKRKPLVDIGDIYLSNQNVGARAVRECLFSVMPPWFTEQAQDLCHATLSGPADTGKSLELELQEGLQGFASTWGVTEGQLAARLGKPREAWGSTELAQMRVLFSTLQRGEITPQDAFATASVTAQEIGS